MPVVAAPARALYALHAAMQHAGCDRHAKQKARWLNRAFAETDQVRLEQTFCGYAAPCLPNLALPCQAGIALRSVAVDRGSLCLAFWALATGT